MDSLVDTGTARRAARSAAPLDDDTRELARIAGVVRAVESRPVEMVDRIVARIGYALHDAVEPTFYPRD